jgi:hypothetical protein
MCQDPSRDAWRADLSVPESLESIFFHSANDGSLDGTKVTNKKRNKMDHTPLTYSYTARDCSKFTNSILALCLLYEVFIRCSDHP